MCGPKQVYWYNLRHDPQFGDNDTFALNASQHWAARYKNGGSAGLIVLKRLVGIMTLLPEVVWDINLFWSSVSVSLSHQFLDSAAM